MAATVRDGHPILVRSGRQLEVQFLSAGCPIFINGRPNGFTMSLN
jgi:hypothetical protein